MASSIVIPNHYMLNLAVFTFAYIVSWYRYCRVYRFKSSTSSNGHTHHIWTIWFIYL